MKYKSKLAPKVWVAACLLATSIGAQAEIVMVGSAQLPISEISMSQLRDLYSGRNTATGDQTILVIDRDPALPERKAFVSKTLRFSTEEFQTMQRLLECIGTAQEPTVARDKNHLLQLLQSSPNAVGYASRKEISAWPHSAKFKEIRVLPQ